MSSGYHEGEFIGAPFDSSLPTLLPDTGAKMVAFEDFMPDGWSDDLRNWGVKNKDKLYQSAKPGSQAFERGWHLKEVEKAYPRCDEFFEQVQRYAPQALAEIGAPFEFGNEFTFEMWLCCRLEDQCFHWHTDMDDKPMSEQTRLLTCCYYMRQTPSRFFGGEHETYDGTMVEPWDNLAVFASPYQTHRVRPVHAQPMGPPCKKVWPDVEPLSMAEGRWNLTCWVHKA